MRLLTMASDPPGRVAGHAELPDAGNRLVAVWRGPSSDRPRRPGARSIRLRLLLPVLVATIGLVALGIQQSLAAVSLADQGGKARTVAATAVATVQLEYQLEREITETDALHQRGGAAGASLVTAARQQTDLAVTDFLAAIGAASRLSPGMRPLLDSARGQLDSLPRARDEVARLGADKLTAPTYDPITATLIAIADALPQQLSDAVLAAKARALVALVADEHLGAQERDVLRGVFRRGSYAGSEWAQLAAMAGQQQERRAEFNRNASVAQRERYLQVWSSGDGTAASRILANALASPPRLAIDPEVWYTAQTNALLQEHELQSELSRDLDLAARSQQDIAQTKALVTALSTVGLVLLALGTALLLAVRTSRRLRRLRAVALSVAQVELPGAIATLRGAHDVIAVRGAVRDATSRVESLGVPGADEITEVGQALGQVHRQALRLAADQAALRIDVAALFVALSRRGQTLIQRQLRLIDDFERGEVDPHRLSRLFAIDHLAARMRRNEENLLVLAGGEPGRKITETVLLFDLVRAAAAEIEDYDRIDPVGIADVGVVAAATRDLIHLLAELLENATYFSPPASRVRVTARRDVDGVQLSVYDEGIGLTAAQLGEVNARLAEPAQLTAELAGTMGLLVVSRLASRHAIEVRLNSAGRGGTVAVVKVPDALLAPAPSLTERTAAMLRRGPGDVVEGEIMPATEESPVLPPRAAVVGGTRAVASTPVPGPAGRPAVTTPGPAAMAPDPGPAPAAVPPPVRPAPDPGPAAFPPAPAAEPAGAVPPSPALTTGTGDLPQRLPGGLLQSDGAAGDSRARPASGNLPPDPELVRTRLAGLASGLAAAARHVEPGTVDNPPRYADTGGERTHATIGQQDTGVPEPDPTPPQDGAR